MELFKPFFAEFNWKLITFNGLRILLILLIAWVLLTVSKGVLQRLERVLIKRGQAEGEAHSEAAKRAATLVHLLHQGLIILVWIVALLVILRELGFDIAPILASAGI